jgi:hypothetical protein
VNNKKWREWCKFVSHLLFNNTYGLPMITMHTKCPNQVFYVCLVDLQKTYDKYGFETWFSSNDDIRNCLFDMKDSSTKNAFCVVNNKKWRKGCKFVPLFLCNNCYGLADLTIDTKCPNHVFYYWLVLNRGWNPDSLQIIIFVNVCSTRGIVELNKVFWDMNNKKWRKLFKFV